MPGALGHLAWQLVVLQVCDLVLTWRGIASGQAQEFAKAGASILGMAFIAGPVVAKVAGTGLAVAGTSWLNRRVRPGGQLLAVVGLWIWWSGMVAVVTWNALVLLL